MTIIIPVAGRKYGGPLLYHWSPGETFVRVRLRRLGPGHYFLQLYLCADCLLLLRIRSCLWIATDGSLQILVWLVGSQAEYDSKLWALHCFR